MSLFPHLRRIHNRIQHVKESPRQCRGLFEWGKKCREHEEQKKEREKGECESGWPQKKMIKSEKSG